MIYLRYSEDDKIFDYVTNLLKEAVERKDLLFVNMLVINETIWILNKKYRIPLSEIIELIDKLIPLLEIIPIDYGDYDIMKKNHVRLRFKTVRCSSHSFNEQDGDKTHSFRRQGI
ncbi:MAG: hypothetical protein QXM02_04890 [Thermoproteota archaeon]